MEGKKRKRIKKGSVCVAWLRIDGGGGGVQAPTTLVGRISPCAVFPSNSVSATRHGGVKVARDTSVETKRSDAPSAFALPERNPEHLLLITP